MLLSIIWDVDPELISIFGREIRWYGLFWALGLLGAVYIVQKIFTAEKLPEKWFDALFIYIIVGTIVGARLGHCLAYDPIYYLSNPLKIFKIWEGGLASHGGTLGIIIAVWLYSRRITKKSMLWTFDRVVVSAGFTAGMIRIGNLMNSEIYGSPTSLPWGFEFQRDLLWRMPISEGGSGSLPCHPTQIYEAIIYFIIFAVAMWMYWKTDAKNKQGLILGVCMIGIFLSRFFIEYLKNIQEPFEIQMQSSIGINMGQLLSVPFVLWGIWLIWNALKNKTINTSVSK